MSLTCRYVYCPYDGSRMDSQTPESGEGGHGRCSKCGYVDFSNPKPCVAVFVFDGSRILMGRRANEPAKGYWDVLGGFVDAGESAEAAVYREVMEETNLRVQIVEYLGSLSDVYGSRECPTLNLVYVVRPESTESKAQSDVAELRWFALDAIPTELAFPHQRQAVELLVAYVRRLVG